MKLLIATVLLSFLTQLNFAQQKIQDTVGIAVVESIHAVTDSALAADSVNIREIVLQQITAARKKMLEEKESAAFTLVKNKVTKETKNDKNFGIVEKIEEFLTKLNKDMVRVMLLGGSTFLVFGTVLIKRIKIKKKSIRHKKLVKNINSIREEKVVVKDDPKLKNVRTRLKSTPEHFSTENSFGETAKELNISKGELFLAARIKSYELSKITN